ncbi:MAG: hypothetical protein QE485_16990 [Acidovorax sp.]|uniref:hypothetical protein n=1 Tax=Acidovorax sp. TaxID=1872122 RepID=UPI002613FAA2|nr:hypothetical protein [Acidovorax sp.]MDH4418908.1 hypothetical protein [Acidovorax sp.]
MATTFTAVDEPSVYRFSYLGDPTSGLIQVATLTNPAAPGVYEVVHITMHNGTDFTIVRGREGTSAVAWAANTFISARVTAAMLESFAQNRESTTGNNGALALGTVDQTAAVRASKGVAINAIGSGVEDAWLIGGTPVLQRVAATSVSLMDRHMTPDGTGATPTVDLGVPPIWTAATQYSDGAIVKSTTPSGQQFLLWMANPSAGPLTSGATEPPFAGPAGAFTEFSPGSGFNNFWTCFNLASGITQDLPMAGVRFYPSEVGFICFERGAGVTTDPVISIGTPAAPTKYANAVALTSLGTNQIHRIAVTDQDGVGGLKFTLGTPAIGGVFRGRFYFKGTFVQSES